MEESKKPLLANSTEHRHAHATPEEALSSADGLPSEGGRETSTYVNDLTDGSTQWTPENLGLNGGYVDANGVTHITYTFNTAPIYEAQDFSTYMNAQDRANIEALLSEYEKVANIQFHEVSDGSRANLNFYNTDNQAVGGFAHYPFVGGSEVYIRDASAYPSDQIDAGGLRYETMAHEIGHALGLSHPGGGEGFTNGDNAAYDTAGTVMSYNNWDPRYFEDAIYATTPQSYDIAALQSMYGANPNYNASDNLFLFDGSQSQMQTNWDTGGTDTIATTQNSGDAYIDLREGPANESRVGETVFFNGIGANIENASTTSGKDTLQGNQLNNTLSGGSNDDKLAGREGNDTLMGGSGSDQFVFTQNFDNDTVQDFSSGDQLVFDSNIFGSKDQILQNVSYADGNAYINAGSHGTVTVENVAPNSLTQDDVRVDNTESLLQFGGTSGVDQTTSGFSGFTALQIAIGVLSAGSLSIAIGIGNYLMARRQFKKDLTKKTQEVYQKQRDKDGYINPVEAIKHDDFHQLKANFKKQVIAGWTISGAISGAAIGTFFIANALPLLVTSAAAVAAFSNPLTIAAGALAFAGVFAAVSYGATLKFAENTSNKIMAESLADKKNQQGIDPERVQQEALEKQKTQNKVLAKAHVKELPLQSPPSHKSFAERFESKSKQKHQSWADKVQAEMSGEPLTNTRTA